MLKDEVLLVSDLMGFYGDSQVLHGVNLNVNRGEVVTLVGRNGAGKTSTLRAIMGLLKKREGLIKVFGREVFAGSPEEIARLGVGYVPEERGIFSTLSVSENLLLPPVIKEGGMSIAEIYSRFPNLKERLRSQGTKLSGGEQQMLAMARVLRTGADLFLLDEPTEGLAPVITDQIGQVIAGMKDRGHTVLLVEQNFEFASDLSDRLLVLEQGRVIDEILRLEIASKMSKLRTYLGI